MTARSQNGWPVLTVSPPLVTVPGASVRLTVRPGDVAVVLVEVARRFHNEVEPLAGGIRDDWGWAYRPVRGQEAGFSNHASGTAVDLNATKHPRGVHGTFGRAKRRKVRAILAALKDPITGRQVVRWGEDYTTTVDGMHFEINADAAAVKRVADQLRQPTPKPAPQPDSTSAARDPLEVLMALSAQERKEILDELAAQLVPRVVDGLLGRQVQLGPAAKRELGVDVATVAQLLQAAPAVATDVRQQLAVLEQTVANLPGEIEAVVNPSVKRL